MKLRLCLSYATYNEGMLANYCVLQGDTIYIRVPVAPLDYG